MIFVQPSPKIKPIGAPSKPPGLGGPPPLQIPWGSDLIRPTVQVGSKPLSGAWARELLSAGPPLSATPAPNTQKQTPWVAAARVGGTGKQGKVVVAQEVGFTMRIGPPKPNVGAGVVNGKGVGSGKVDRRSKK